MWIEVDRELFVNLNQVCAVEKRSVVSSHWYEFRLPSGEVVQSHVFESEEEAESWFRDEVLPFLVREREKSPVGGE